MKVKADPPTEAEEKKDPAKDENKALELLNQQSKILSPITSKFNGTLHKEIGDGLLFTFPTVTEAVKCGIKIQEQTKANDDLNLRIGIHEGEISLKDGDVLGDRVILRINE